MKTGRLGNGLGDSLGLSLTASSQKVVNEQAFVVNRKDRRILRELAHRVAELAACPIELVKKNCGINIMLLNRHDR